MRSFDEPPLAAPDRYDRAEIMLTACLFAASAGLVLDVAKAHLTALDTITPGSKPIAASPEPNAR